LASVFAAFLMASCERGHDTPKKQEQKADLPQSEIIDLIVSRLEREEHCRKKSMKSEIPAFTQSEIQKRNISVGQLLAQIRIKHHENRVECAGEIDHEFSSVCASHSDGQIADLNSKEIDALEIYCLYVLHSRINPEMREIISFSQEHSRPLSAEQLTYINDKIGDGVFSIQKTERAIIYSFDDPLTDLLKQISSRQMLER